MYIAILFFFLSKQIDKDMRVWPKSSVVPNNDGQSWTGGKSMGSHVSTQPVPTMEARAQVTAAKPAVKARNEKQLCVILPLEVEELELYVASPFTMLFSMGCIDCCVSGCGGVSER